MQRVGTVGAPSKFTVGIPGLGYLAQVGVWAEMVRSGGPWDHKAAIDKEIQKQSEAPISPSNRYLRIPGTKSVCIETSGPTSTMAMLVGRQLGSRSMTWATARSEGLTIRATG